MESRNKYLISVISILVVVVSATLLVSCSPKCWPWNKWKMRDSVAVHYKDSTIFKDSLRIRDSLMLVPIPVEGSQNIFPTFIPSHLETSLAVSDAFVDSLGLHHSLKNKETDIGVHVPVTDHTTIIEHTTQKDSTSAKEDTPPPQIIEVEKPLPKWKQFQIDAFWWLFGSLILSLIVIFRKPLWKIIKRVIP